MKTRSLRTAALILGVLGILSLIWQIRRAWPPDQFGFYFFGTQAAVLYAFLSYGLGIGPMAPRTQATYPDASGVESSPPRGEHVEGQG